MKMSCISLYKVISCLCKHVDRIERERKPSLNSRLKGAILCETDVIRDNNRNQDGRKKRCYMSKKQMYEARTEELITPILERFCFELVDVEYVKEGS